MAHTFGTADVDFFDGVGHWLPAEAPSEVASRLVKLLQRGARSVSEASPTPPP